jgi:hypothetical protein
VLVGVAQARDIEFVANNPGDWMVHCHLPHHNMNQMSSTVGRMTRGNGMPAGVDMNTSMGMLEGTPPVPMGDDYGPSLGRGMGVASASDMATTNGPLSGRAMHQAMPKMQMQSDEIAPNANSVPNFPQDAFMEGSMMNMDAMVATPANAGLLPGWSAQMQGMMTLIRVLPQPDYDRMMASIRNYKSDEKRKPDNAMPGMHHEHGHEGGA